MSKYSKDHFEARLLHPEAAEGAARELALLDFGGESLSMELTKRDFRVLKDEGLTHFRWDLPDRGTGRLSSLTFDAENKNFRTDDVGTQRLWRMLPTSWQSLQMRKPSLCGLRRFRRS